MNQLFMIIISISASGSLIFLLIYMMRLVFKRFISQAWRYYIWVAVLIRMLLPFSPENSIVGEMFATFDAPIYSTATEIVSDYSDNTEPAIVESMATPVSDTLSTKSNTQSFDFWSAVKNNLGFLWLFVAFILLTRKVVKYYSFIKFMKASRFAVADCEILKSYRQICSSMGIARPPKLYVSKVVVTPLLVGVINPFIVLPETSFTVQQLGFIFRHELTHYKRHDLLYKWMAQITACIHWFNPLIYVTIREIDKGCELSCDEAIVKNVSLQERQYYGDTLISSVKNSAHSFKGVAVAIMNENITDLKERLVFIMKNSPKTKASSILSLSLATLILTGAFYSGAYAGAVKNNELPIDTSATQIVEDLTETKPLVNEESGKGEAYYSFLNQSATFTSNFADYVNNYIISASITNSPIGSDETKITVGNNGNEKHIWFTDETKALAENKVVLEAVQKLTQQNAQKAPKEASSWRYVITDISGPYSETPDELADKFYKNNSLLYFSAVCTYTSGNKMAEFFDKAYNDNRTDFFAVLCNYMGEDKKTELLSKAYNDSKISFFSILLNNTGNVDYDAFALKAYNSNRTDFFAVLCNYMGESKKTELLSKAYNDSKISFFSILLNNIGNVDYDDFALKAYNSNRIDFFSVLCNYMGESKKTEFLNKSFKDGRIDFLSVLS